MRVCAVITARPSYARIKTALESIRRRGMDLKILACASAVLERYGDVSKVIERDGFGIAKRLSWIVEGNEPANMVQSVGLGAIQLAKAGARGH